MPVLYTSTRILNPFEDTEPTGLKVDIARFPGFNTGQLVSSFLNQRATRNLLLC